MDASLPEPLRSALYEGRVRHRRARPAAHAFTYRVFHALLDLDELDVLDRQVRGFRHARPAVAAFHDRDHLGALDLPVKEKLRRWLAGQGVALPDGPVLLACNLRVLGYVFDPVSWFFCYDRGGTLRLVGAEVHNTFGETHGYILDDLQWTGADRVEATASKVFHVSPFMDIPDHRYHFVLRPPRLDDPVGAPFAVHMDVADQAGTLLDATLGTTRVPFTTTSLWRLLARIPLVTAKTMLAIHWQALRLWLKRVPFHPKPVPPADGLDAIDRPTDDRMEHVS